MCRIAVSTMNFPIKGHLAWRCMILGGALVLTCFVAPSSMAAVITTFSGADAGEGLDLDGTFDYAVNLGGSATGTIRDATFTDVAGAPAGFSENGNSDFSGTSPNYGASTDDNTLESIMQTVRFDSVDTSFDVVLANLTPGSQYQYQILLHEPSGTPGDNGRILDISVEGVLEADNLDLFDFGSTAGSGTGVVITDTFLATALNTSLDINVARDGGSFFPILNAVTLEDLGTPSVPLAPEPSTLLLGTLCLVLLVGWYFRRWRRGGAVS